MSRGVYWLERAFEAVVGNRLGARVYRSWVASLDLHGDERALDVGTGSGACARHLAAALPEGSLTCVDVDARWQAVARGRLADAPAQVELVAVDIAHYSRPGFFDVAVLHFVLHDIPAEKRSAALVAIARSLKPGGRLCVREPVTHGMTEAEMLGLLVQSGFTVIDEVARQRVPLMGATISGWWVRAAS